MTEPTTDPTRDDAAPQPDPAGTPPADDGGDPSKGTDQPEGTGKEAARYRVRLRETEAERDQLRTLVETYQRAEAERAVSDILNRPAGMWAAGTNLADLLDDDGRVNSEKAIAAATAAQETLGLERRRRTTPGPDLSQGRGRSSSGTKTWGDVLRRD